MVLSQARITLSPMTAGRGACSMEGQVGKGSQFPDNREYAAGPEENRHGLRFVQCRPRIISAGEITIS